MSINFLDISGLYQYLKSLSKRLFIPDQQEYIYSPENSLKQPIFEQSYDLSTMAVGEYGYMQYPLFPFGVTYISSVPEKTYIKIKIVETGESFIVNGFGTFDYPYNPNNRFSISAAIVNGSMNLIFIVNNAGRNTSYSISGVLTVRYTLNR